MISKNISDEIKTMHDDEIVSQLKKRGFGTSEILFRRKNLRLTLFHIMRAEQTTKGE